MKYTKQKRTIQLPRGYLSYSQIALWISDQEKYKQLYFDGRDELRTTNLGQEYGKVVADLLERGEGSDDVLTDTAMFLLPKYDVADKEIRTTIHTKDGDIPIVLKPDSMDSQTFAFYEYKTGKHAWTKHKAYNHLQLKLYAVGIRNEFGVTPPSIELIWIETEQKEVEGPDGKTLKEIKPTGRIERFPVTYTTRDYLETKALITRVAKEIEVAYAMHTPNRELLEF